MHYSFFLVFNNCFSHKTSVCVCVEQFTIARKYKLSFKSLEHFKLREFHRDDNFLKTNLENSLRDKETRKSMLFYKTTFAM